MLDTYNQAIHTDCSCTIRTNINTANHHFIMECKFFQYPRGANKGGILNTEICPTISTSSWENNCLLIEDMTETQETATTICLNSKIDGSGGGGREPKILDATYGSRDSREYENYSPSLRAERNGFLVKEATKQGYDIAAEGDSVNLSNPNSSTRRGRVGKQIANTLDTGCQQGVVAKYRIRKLTPRECFRLMGVNDAEIDKIQASGISNSQQYKLAGNSIVVDNLYHIFRKMFVETNAEQNQQLKLF